MPSTTTRTYPHMLKVKHKIWLNHRAQRICWRQKTSGLPYTWRFLHGALQMAQISGASKGPVLCYVGTVKRGYSPDNVQQQKIC